MRLRKLDSDWILCVHVNKLLIFFSYICDNPLNYIFVRFLSYFESSVHPLSELAESQKLQKPITTIIGWYTLDRSPVHCFKLGFKRKEDSPRCFDYIAQEIAKNWKVFCTQLEREFDNNVMMRHLCWCKLRSQEIAVICHFSTWAADCLQGV